MISMSYKFGASGDQRLGESTVKEKSPVVHLCVDAPPGSPRGVMVISTDALELVEVVMVPLTG